MRPWIRSSGLLLATLMVALVGASSAAAARCEQVPGDNSEVDQYTETVPGSCGGKKAEGGGGEGGPGGTGSPGGTDAVVPAETSTDLSEFGADGLAAAALAAATAPGRGGPGAGGRDRGGLGRDRDSGAGAGFGVGGPGIPGAVGASDGSAADAILSALTLGSGEGAGAVLPVGLGAILAGGLAFGLVRRRSDSA